MNSLSASFVVVAVLAVSLLAFFVSQGTINASNSFSLHGTDPNNAGNTIVVQATESSLTFDIVSTNADGSLTVNRYLSEFPEAIFRTAFYPTGKNPLGDVQTFDWVCSNGGRGKNSTKDGMFLKSADGKDWMFFLEGRELHVKLAENGLPTDFAGYHVDKFQFDLSIHLTEGTTSFDENLIYQTCGSNINLMDGPTNASDGSYVTFFQDSYDKSCVSSRDICALQNIYDPRWLSGPTPGTPENPEWFMFQPLQYTCADKQYDASVYAHCFATTYLHQNNIDIQFLGFGIFSDHHLESTFIGTCRGKLDHNASHYIVIAGTRTYAGWIADANYIPIEFKALGNAEIHGGMANWFLLMVSTLYGTSDVNIQITLADLNSGCLGGVVVMGHSLGGACSSMFALYLNLHQGCSAMSVMMITCGEPQTMFNPDNITNGYGSFASTRWVAWNGVSAFAFSAMKGWRTLRDVVPFACSYADGRYRHSDVSGGYFGRVACFYREFHNYFDENVTADFYTTGVPSFTPGLQCESMDLHTMNRSVQWDQGYRKKVAQNYCLNNGHNGGDYNSIRFPKMLSKWQQVTQEADTTEAPTTDEDTTDEYNYSCLRESNPAELVPEFGYTHYFMNNATSLDCNLNGVSFEIVCMNGVFVALHSNNYITQVYGNCTPMVIIDGISYSQQLGDYQWLTDPNAPELLTQRGRDAVMAHDGTGTTQFPDGTQLGMELVEANTGLPDMPSM